MGRSRSRPSGRLMIRRFRAVVWSGLVLAFGLMSPLPVRGQDTVSPVADKAERPAFELTYVPSDAIGVLAVRPNVIFRDPTMRPLARMADEALAEFLNLYKFPTDRKLPIEEIEQIVGFISPIPNGKAPRGVPPGGASLVMIRAAHDFDWGKLMRQIDPKPEAIHWKGLVYYKCHLKGVSVAPKNAHFYYFIPDNRTLVIPPPGVFRAAENGKIGPHPRFSWDKDWKRVEHDCFAVALDNRWTRGLSKEQMGETLGQAWFVQFVQNATTMVGGMDWKDGIDFHAFLACKDGAIADQTRRKVKAYLTGMQFMMEQTSQSIPESEQEKVIPASVKQEIDFQMQLWTDLMQHAHITRRESTIRLHTTAKINIVDVVKMLTPAMPPK